LILDQTKVEWLSLDFAVLCNSLGNVENRVWLQSLIVNHRGAFDVRVEADDLE